MKRIDLTNRRFGRLTVIGFAGVAKNGNALWNCQCDCGQKIVADGYLLRKGNTRSCGCLRRERGREVMKTNTGLIANRGNINNLKQFGGTSVISMTKTRKTNKSGVPGVFYDKRVKRWVARLMFRGKYVLNRSFATFEEAVYAREKAVATYLNQVLVPITIVN